MIATAATALVLAVGTPIAYALARYAFRGKSLLRSFLLGPLIVPRVALGFSLFILFVVVRAQLYGTLAGIIIAHSILMLPFVVSILLANLTEIDPSLEEAARDLGAGPVAAFFKAALPQIKPGVTVAGVFAFIASFDEVETTLFLTKPAVNTLPVEMYHYLEYQQEPMIAAVSTLLVLASLLCILAAALFSGGGFFKQLFARGG